MVWCGVMARAETTKRQIRCHTRDIIRTPVERGGQQRILAVCARCGAFRDVTGVPRERVFKLLHRDWQFNGNTLSPPEKSE